MRWLSNLRLPEGGPQLWRIGLDGQDQIAVVEALAPGSAAAGADWQGDWLSPGGVDLQINGGLGLAFPELTEADLPQLDALLDLLWIDGVEAICPTLVTCAVAPLRQGLAVLRAARQRHRSGRCRLLGAHLEGPFLAHARRGAHPASHLCAPSRSALLERIGGFEGEIDLVTLAPELEGAGAVIGALKELGIVVSLGHSEANETEASAAFGAGLSMLTHSLNAMAGLHHRAPGPVAAALLAGGVHLGLIADGVHVAPSMAVLLQRLAGEQLVLVSDALAPYGLADGRHRWDERELLVEQGTCRVPDGTLAGVSLPLLEGVRRLAQWTSEPARAIAAATVLPRRVLGDDRSLDQMLLGMPLAETLRWQVGPAGLSWQRPGAEVTP